MVLLRSAGFTFGAATAIVPRFRCCELRNIGLSPSVIVGAIVPSAIAFVEFPMLVLFDIGRECPRCEPHIVVRKIVVREYLGIIRVGRQG